MEVQINRHAPPTPTPTGGLEDIQTVCRASEVPTADRDACPAPTADRSKTTVMRCTIKTN